MTKTLRLLNLLQRLRQQRRPMRAETLARQLGISVRTVYRDIETLRDQGADIRGEAGVGFVLHRGSITLPPLLFSKGEIEALVLGMRWVMASTDSSLREDAISVLSRIEAVLPEALSAHIRNTACFPLVGTATSSSAEQTVLDEIRRAMRDERCLRFDYVDANGAPSQRSVWPLALGWFEQTRLLAAWCTLRQDFRHFRTDRIHHPIMAGPMPMPRPLILRRWQEHNNIDLLTRFEC
ncbi:MAG: YafY family protein [Lautropia sp.]|nr:YafY family protein [Lautropia sp.]